MFSSSFRPLALLAMLLFPLLSIGDVEAAEQDISFMVRPHCDQGYKDEDWPFGPIPSPGFVVEVGEGKCPPFETENPQTLRTREMHVGETLDIDIVVQNPTKQKIALAQAWLNYDPNILQGVSIDIATDNFPEIIPGQNDFSATEGYAKAGGTAPAGKEKDNYWIPLARVQFRVLKYVPTGAQLSFYNVQSAGDTKVSVRENGTETPALGEEPGSLLVRLIDDAGSTGSVASTGSTSSESGGICTSDADCGAGQTCVNNMCSTGNQQASSAASQQGTSSVSSAPATTVGSGDACTSDDQCLSALCYQGSCQEPGFKIPDGGACRRDNQCSSLTCLDGVCVSATNLPDGQGCASNAECSSNLCQNGVCTATGQQSSQAQQSSSVPSGPPLPPVTSSASSSAQTQQSSAMQSSSSSSDEANATGTMQSSQSSAASSTPVTGNRTAFGILQVQNLRLTTEGSTVFLAWDALKATALKGYNIYYGTTPGQYIHRASVDGSSTNASIENLPQGTKYYFAVRGVSTGNEESAFSTEVSITVGDPSTASALLTASSVTPTVDKNPLGTLQNTGADSVVPGETGLPHPLLIISLLAAVLGTAIATRRQVIATSQPPLQ